MAILRKGLVYPKDNRMFYALKPIRIIDVESILGGKGYIIPILSGITPTYRTAQGAMPKVFEMDGASGDYKNPLILMALEAIWSMNQSAFHPGSEKPWLKPKFDCITFHAYCPLWYGGAIRIAHDQDYVDGEITHPSETILYDIAGRSHIYAPNQTVIEVEWN